jgi:hypothetical protein
LALSSKQLDLAQNRLDIVDKGIVGIFLVLIEQDHLFQGTKDAILLFQLN